MGLACFLVDDCISFYRSCIYEYIAYSRSGWRPYHVLVVRSYYKASTERKVYGKSSDGRYDFLIALARGGKWE